jgi:hypothetical protein
MQVARGVFDVDILMLTARLSADNTPQRWTFSKSPYGNPYLALACSPYSSSMPKCHLPYSL